mmetsp:Transcript_45528/g.145181  ORF Transcript_45528/g.145181 Transcript_45528/m.145181 type:complete len:202 (+) Transcript_45528:518-1123(+)
MLFVGAASSPAGSSSSFQGTSAPDQLEPKMKRKMVLTKGTQGRYRDSPRLFLAMSEVKPSAISWKFRTPEGAWYSETGALAWRATAPQTLTVTRALSSKAGSSVAPEKAPGAAVPAAVEVRKLLTCSPCARLPDVGAQACPCACVRPALTPARVVPAMKATVWKPTHSAAANARSCGSAERLRAMALLRRRRRWRNWNSAP